MKKPRNANKNLKPNNCYDWTMVIVSSFLFCSLAVDISKRCTVTYQLANNNKPDYITQLSTKLELKLKLKLSLATWTLEGQGGPFIGKRPPISASQGQF